MSNTYLDKLCQDYQRCRKAFFQAPSPRLGSAIRQLESKIRYEERLIRATAH